MFLAQRFARSASLRAPVSKGSLMTLLAARGCWSALRVLESGLQRRGVANDLSVHPMVLAAHRGLPAGLVFSHIHCVWTYPLCTAC